MTSLPDPFPIEPPREPADLPTHLAELRALTAFLARQDHSALVAVLIEQAQRSEAVLQRLRRWHIADQPERLAHAFRERLHHLFEAADDVTWRDAQAFTDKLTTWVDSVEAELAPRAPMEALALLNAFIEADGTLVVKADQDGEIGPVVNDACDAWLRTAARCADPSTGQLPEPLLDRIRALCSGDEYGMRSPLRRAL